MVRGARGANMADHKAIPGKRLCEERFYCFGEVDGGVLTVRFSYRASVIRIIGAGYWRKGRAIYERENEVSD